MQGRLVRNEKENQKKNKGNTPRGTTSSVDGTRLRSWHGEAYLGCSGEPVNNDDQEQWRNYQQTLQQLRSSGHDCIINYVPEKATDECCGYYQEPDL